MYFRAAWLSLAIGVTLGLVAGWMRHRTIAPHYASKIDVECKRITEPRSLRTVISMRREHAIILSAIALDILITFGFRMAARPMIGGLAAAVFIASYPMDRRLARDVPATLARMQLDPERAKRYGRWLKRNRWTMPLFDLTMALIIATFTYFLIAEVYPMSQAIEHDTEELRQILREAEARYRTQN